MHFTLMQFNDALYKGNALLLKKIKVVLKYLG